MIFTPAVDLMSVVQPGLSASARFTAFERLIVAPGAAASDAFEVQSQQTEGTSAAASFVANAIAVARVAHPGAPVLAGLSTNPDGRHVTPGDLLALYHAAAAAGASGYWLNIPETSRECPRCGLPQTSIAVAFLQNLARVGAGG